MRYDLMYDKSYLKSYQFFCVTELELYTTVLPAVFLVSVFCRYEI